MSNVPLPSDFKQEEQERLKDAYEELDSLTPKQRQAFLFLIKNPTAGKLAAARAAGYSVNSASRASSIFKTIEGRLGKTFRDIAGVDESDLVLTFAAGLKAEKTAAIKVGIYEKFPVYDKQGNKVGEQPMKVGEEIRIVNLGPDIKLRLDTAKHIARMGGYEAPLKMQLEHQHQHSFNSETVAELKRHARELERQRMIETDCEIVDGNDADTEQD